MGSPFSGSLLAKGEVGEVAEAEQQTEQQTELVWMSAGCWGEVCLPCFLGLMVQGHSGPFWKLRWMAVSWSRDYLLPELSLSWLILHLPLNGCSEKLPQRAKSSRGEHYDLCRVLKMKSRI